MQTAINTNPATPFPCLMTGHEAAHAARLESRAVKCHHVEAAFSKTLGDLDTLVDWLGGECFQRTQVDSDRATRVPGRLLTADTAVVLHAALVAADRQDAAGCLEAMRVLTQRYLELQDARVQDLARELAGA